MQGLAEAQHAYDSALPPEYYDIEEIRLPFSDFDVEQFIRDFAYTADAHEFLHESGIRDQYAEKAIGIELLQALCKTWVKDRMCVYNAASVLFWQTMRDLAYEAYTAQ